MDTTNRLFIVLCAAAWVVVMAVIIFLTWAAPDRTINRLGDFVEFLGNNNTDAGKLVVTLAAIAAGIIAFLVMVLEVAPDDNPSELRVEQAGATMVVPADALRMRLEEALLMLPDVTAARTHVRSRDKGIAASMELTVPPGVSIANLTQEAVRVVVEAIQTDLGLPVSGVPPVKFTFGGSRAPVHPIPETPPVFANPAPMATVQTVDERISTAPPTAPATTPAPEPAVEPSASTPPVASPPYAYDSPPSAPQSQPPFVFDDPLSAPESPPEQPPSQPF
jgi:hypothetical protein